MSTIVTWLTLSPSTALETRLLRFPAPRTWRVVAHFFQLEDDRGFRRDLRPPERSS